jgi:hypothetical protein
VDPSPFNEDSTARLGERGTGCRAAQRCDGSSGPKTAGPRDAQSGPGHCLGFRVYPKTLTANRCRVEGGGVSQLGVAGRGRGELCVVTV